jgi:hypothetical protein
MAFTTFAHLQVDEEEVRAIDLKLKALRSQSSAEAEVNLLLVRNNMISQQKDLTLHILLLMNSSELHRGKPFSRNWAPITVIRTGRKGKLRRMIFLVP